MEKEFVPYDRALRMKALGFDEPCFSFYMGGFKDLGKIKYVNPSNVAETNVLAPTFSQAFRWFREKHEIFGVITSEKDDNYYNTEFFGYSVYKTKVNAPLSIGLDLKENASYEEAELTCLDKLIKIVESKVKK